MRVRDVPAGSGVKNGSYQTNGRNIRAAIEANDPQLVLVDFFDTVVTRSVHRKQVKPIVARHVRDRLGLGCEVDRLLQTRRTAERQLEEQSVGQGFDPEHRLGELAGEIWRLLEQDPGSAPGTDRETFVALWITIELGVERLAQQVDPEVVAALRSEVGRRPLVLVSDFYIPSDHFVEMLGWHGLGDLFDEVFVSCDHRLSKASGRLYEHVLKTRSASHGPVEPARILMIGDNPVSDGLRAEQAGLRAVLIERPPDRAPNRMSRRFVGSWPERRLAIGRAIHTQGRTPFVELAVTLFFFTRLLHERARARGDNQLLFLAREGKFLRLLFERYQELTPSADSPIRTDYLVVSRRSTALPSLAPFDDEDFSSLLEAYPGISISDLIASLGLGPELTTEVTAALGVGADSPADIEALRTEDSFRTQYTAARNEQKALLQQYIVEVVGDSAQPLTLVDVGWKGTMQDHLQAALGPQQSIDGLYLGVVGGNLRDSDRKHAVLFDSRLPVTPSYRVLRHFKSIYEYLLQADHGSAERYRRAGPGEAVVPVLDVQPKEVDVFDRLIGPTQQTILAAFSELCRQDALRDHPLLADIDDVARCHARMLFFPHSDEVNLIRQLEHYENFGLMTVVRPGDTQAAGGQGLRRRIRLLSRPRRILGSGWPPLTLTEAGLRPLIPVVGAYRGVREIAVPSLAGVRRRLRDRNLRRRVLDQ